MKNNDKNIHDFDFNLICDYFSSTERQGPGSTAATLAALHKIEPISPSSTIIDLGCGTGASTLLLAEQCNCKVIGIDLFEQFLVKLRHKAAAKGIAVDTLVCSMDNLPFAPASIDVIWCEGAIYNIGIERGLSLWHHLLKDGGYVVFSDATWLTNSPPREVANFWEEAYPAMGNLEQNLALIKSLGYEVIDHFTLDSKCWTENFYKPQHKAQVEFLARHPNNPTAQELVANQQREAEIYNKYGSLYGYVFYIVRKQ